MQNKRVKLIPTLWSQQQLTLPVGFWILFAQHSAGESRLCVVSIYIASVQGLLFNVPARINGASVLAKCVSGMQHRIGGPSGQT
eukprot:SAG31_NODE_1642_length_7657_cov_3.459402_7_plen_84_part_00